MGKLSTWAKQSWPTGSNGPCQASQMPKRVKQVNNETNDQKGLYGPTGPKWANWLKGLYGPNHKGPTGKKGKTNPNWLIRPTEPGNRNWPEWTKQINWAKSATKQGEMAQTSTKDQGSFILIYLALLALFVKLAFLARCLV